jgi:CheY-like chemotaxis protein
MIDIHTMSVLIVDDMENMRRAIRNMMKIPKYGQSFLLCSNGEEAWGMLQKEHVDLVIVDYNMPVMSGGELISRIREDRNLRDLPVVMITAMAQMEYVSEAAESEIDAYMLKPITVKLLEDKVLSVVNKANNPSPMVSHLKRARNFELDADFDAAIREAKLAMDVNPKSSRPLREIGYYYFQKQDFDEAEKWLLQAVEMNHMDVIALHYLGEINLHRNDMEKAALYFDEAMNLSPRHLLRGVNFGKILLEKQMIPKAIQVFKKALTLSGGSLELREEIANFCIEKGAKEYGAELLEFIIKKNPNRSDLFYQLGKTLGEIGENSKAIVYLSDAEDFEPENSAIKINLAKNYLSIKMPIRAERPLRAVLKSCPKHPEAQELLQKCS